MQYVILGVWYVVSTEQIAILESDSCIINKYIDLILIREKGEKKHALVVTHPVEASSPF